MKKKIWSIGFLLLLVLTICISAYPAPAEAAVEGVSVVSTFWVDREYTFEGEYIGFRFKFVNNGTVTVSGLAVRDAKIANNAWLNSPLTLAPGETRIVTYNLALNHEVTVSPVAKYSAGGSDYRIDFKTVRLYVIDDDIKVTLEADTTTPAAGEEVTFKATMTNNGNVPLRNLKLYNHNNELVPLRGTQLYAGNTASVTTTATFKESDSVQFDITATDAYGTVYSAASNTIEIKIPINFSADNLSVTAEAASSKLSIPGPATFDILITNNSEYGLYDISITDMGTGEVVESITNMEKGERLVRVKTEVEASREIAFQVDVHDADGNTFTVDTTDNPTMITVLSEQTSEAEAEAEAAEALVTPAPSATPAPVAGFAGLSIWVIIIIALGVLTLAVIVAIFVLIAAGKKPPANSGEPAPKKTKKKVKKGASNPPAPTVKPIPKKRPKGPKRKDKKKHKGPIRVSYRDRSRF